MVSLASPRSVSVGSAPTSTMLGGIRYEARVTKWLLEQGLNFHPQVEFETTEGRRFRPDGLLFSSDWEKLVVVEIKTQESQEAMAQLASYQTRVSAWFRKDVRGLLVCETAFPFNLALVPHITAVFSESPFMQMVMTMAARNLPRVRGARRCGLGMVARGTDDPLRASRGVGDGAGGSVGAPILAAPPGADFA